MEDEECERPAPVPKAEPKRKSSKHARQEAPKVPVSNSKTKTKACVCCGCVRFEIYVVACAHKQHPAVARYWQEPPSLQRVRHPLEEVRCHLRVLPGIEYKSLHHLTCSMCRASKSGRIRPAVAALPCCQSASDPAPPPRPTPHKSKNLVSLPSLFVLILFLGIFLCVLAMSVVGVTCMTLG